MPELSAPDPAKLLLTIDEAARALSVSVRTVHKLVACRALGTVRIGRCVRFRPDALQDFIREHADAGRWRSWDDARTAREPSTRSDRVNGEHRSGSAPGSASAPAVGRRPRPASGSRRSSKLTPRELRTLAARIASETS